MQDRELNEATSAPMAAPPPQGFPYDNLFKILIIGDAATGKVSRVFERVAQNHNFCAER